MVNSTEIFILSSKHPKKNCHSHFSECLGRLLSFSGDATLFGWIGFLIDLMDDLQHSGRGWWMDTRHTNTHSHTLTNNNFLGSANTRCLRPTYTLRNNRKQSTQLSLRGNECKASHKFCNNIAHTAQNIFVQIIHFH